MPEKKGNYFPSIIVTTDGGTPRQVGRGPMQALDFELKNSASGDSFKQAKKICNACTLKGK